VILKGVALEGWTGDARELSVQAREASIDLGTRIAQLDQVRIALADSQAGPVEVQAPAGQFDLARDALWLKGGVEGRTGPDERFTTEEMRLDQDTGHLHSEYPVRLERPNLDLKAASMDFDMRARRLRLLGGVSAELRAQE
jgi:LPS export ABC transporter protein LptC